MLIIKGKPMSYSIQVVGKDKAKLKAAIKAQEAKPENPHSGVPPRMTEHLCNEVDRCRMYDRAGTQYALLIKASGGFHEQGSSDTSEVTQVQLVE
jgi:hypothetical protein